MKPRSNIERRFVDYANILPPIWNEISEYAYSNHFDAEAYYWQHRGNNQEIWCQCCGHREPCDSWLVMSAEDYVCPACGKVCKVKQLRKDSSTRATSCYYLSVFDIFNGIQVVRTFEVFRSNYKSGPTDYSMSEVYQNWILENGREIITSRPFSRGWNFMRWDYTAGYGIQTHNARSGGYFSYGDLFDVSDNWIFPKIKLAKYMRSNGIDARKVKSLYKRSGCSVTDALSKWMQTPYYETLWKIGQRDIFWHFMKSDCHRKLAKYADSIKIALRHGYAIPDLRMWLDYIDDLIELGLDTRSPHYLCPEDLERVHDRMTARVRRIRDRKAAEKQLQEIEAYEPKYQKRIAPYIGLCFRISDIEITCLPTVQSVYAEGKAMSHCIFQREYYKNIHSLLMTAHRISTGERLETLEISLTSFTILQSRGRNNTMTPQHDTIVRLVNANMKHIRNISKHSIAI